MPKLFLIRHAIAEDRDVFKKTGRPDTERPLTEDGKERMRKIAKKLYELHPEIETFLQSPLRRSQETTLILKKYYKKTLCQTLKELTPSAPPDSLRPVLKYYEGQSIAIVGHEPHLSHLLSYLLIGKSASPLFAFKKGGIACLDNSRAGASKLLWMSTPKTWL